MNPVLTESQVTVTATTDGTGTGTIPDTAVKVLVVSSAANKQAILPTPTPGRKLSIYCDANGFDLLSNAPATVAINGGVGAGKKLAVAAGDKLELECVVATKWTGIKIGATGTVASAGAAA